MFFSYSVFIVFNICVTCENYHASKGLKHVFSTLLNCLYQAQILTQRINQEHQNTIFSKFEQFIEILTKTRFITQDWICTGLENYHNSV